MTGSGTHCDPTLIVDLTLQHRGRYPRPCDRTHRVDLRRADLSPPFILGPTTHLLPTALLVHPSKLLLGLWLPAIHADLDFAELDILDRKSAF